METRAFNLFVEVFAPDNPERVHSYTYNCYFNYDEHQRGKKTVLLIMSARGGSDRYIDLRFDKSYTRGREWEYLVLYAHNYWNGVNGAWALKQVTISRDINAE